MPNLDFSQANDVRFGTTDALTVRMGNIDVWERPPRPATMLVVAHQDDDLYFINPDLMSDIDSGQDIVVVYLTAGDAGFANDNYWQGRELGVQAAYAQMMGASDSWTVSSVEAAGKTVRMTTLDRIRLIFLRLPDGNGDGAGTSTRGNVSIAQLWGGFGNAAASIAALDGSETYTKAELLASLRSLADQFSPNVVRTLDGRPSVGDHSDHTTTGRFVLSAFAGRVETISPYRGYGVTSEPVNVVGTAYSRKLAALQSYAAHDPQLGAISSAWVERCYTAAPVAPLTPQPGPGGGGSNLAMDASVLVSSENQTDQQLGVKAINGVIEGFSNGSYLHEWATISEKTDAWIELRWSSPQTIGRIVLYDRPNNTDNVGIGTLSFSDGSTVSTPALVTNGSATTVSFTARTVSWVRYTWHAGVGVNTGLAEIQAYES